MNEEFNFTLHRRGTHRLAGRTVLQIVGALESDADRPAIEVAGVLASVGARALIAAPNGRLVSELQAKGGVWLDFPSQSKNPLAMLVNIRRLKALLAREQVDLVHAHSRPGAWVAYSTARQTKTPLVTSLHQISPGQSIIKQGYNSVMAKGDLVIAGSKSAAATITSIYPGAAGRTVLIRPGVDLRNYAASTILPARVQSLRSAWQIAPDERIILMIGRTAISRGHKTALEALQLLYTAGLKDLKLVFIMTGAAGKSASSREVDQAIKASQSRDRVRKVESCSDMPAALLAAVVLFVPAIAAEAYGRIVVEAQAVGTPAVVSDLGAVAETVLAPPETPAVKRTGWRVSQSDPAVIAVVLREALSLGASGRDHFATRARQQAEARFSIDRMTRETLDAYATLLERQATT